MNNEEKNRKIAEAQSRPRIVHGYVWIWAPGHPRAKSKRMQEHILIAEKALGRYIPREVEVHHFDEVRGHNENNNLVICQDQQYHALLHRRARVLRAGGDPNTQQLCCSCRIPKDFSEFHKNKNYRGIGRNPRCKACMSVQGAATFARRMQKRRS